MPRSSALGGSKRRSKAQKTSLKKASAAKTAQNLEDLALIDLQKLPESGSSRQTRAQSVLATKKVSFALQQQQLIQRLHQGLSRSQMSESKAQLTLRKLRAALDLECDRSAILEVRLSVAESSLDDANRSLLDLATAAESFKNTSRELADARHSLKTDRQHLRRVLADKLELQAMVSSQNDEIDRLGKDVRVAQTSLASAVVQLHQLSPLRSLVEPTLAENTRLKIEAASAADENNRLSSLADSLSKQLADLRTSFEIIREKYIKCNKDSTKREKKLKSSAEALSRRTRAKISISQKLKHATSFTIRKKGIISSETRSLIRDLQAAGCPAANVGKVIDTMVHTIAPDCNAAKDSKQISARTAGRAVGEGGLASQLQVIQEIKDANGITLSGDGTTNRSINYKSQSVTLLVPDSYALPPGERFMRHKTRSLGVHLSTNHKSETQLEGWKETFARGVELYNKSPLAKGDTLKMSVADIIGNVVGMHSDHAEDQKKLARITSEFKKKVANESLGRKRLKAMSESELQEILDRARNDTIEKLGGRQAWDTLSPEMQRIHTDRYTSEVACQLGELALRDMTEVERTEFELFVWTGCCMHKLLNAVKGAMSEIVSSNFYSSRGLQGPIMLPNRDNAAVLSDPAAAETSSRARAAAETQAGAIKLAALMGAYLNNRDDKKGLHDVGLIYLASAVGDKNALRFPDTNNTRYQSYVNATAEIIARLPIYKKLLEHTRDLKEKQNFNHMEVNIYAGLHDTPTIAESIALTLFGEAICFPYTRATRSQESLNALDLGPLHRKVCTHLQKIIDCPEVILSPDADPKSAVLDGKDWFREESVKASQELAKNIPYMRDLLITVFTGALKTFERFCSEFVEGGIISSMDEAARMRAFMPATNDHNEGALGTMRIFSRNSTKSTLHQFNARFMYLRNGTKYFLQSMTNSADFEAFLRRQWREIDCSKLEARRKRALFKAQEALLREKEARAQVRKARKEAAAAKLDAINFVLEDDAIMQMKAIEIQLQLRYLRRLNEDALIPKVKLVKNKADALPALREAMKRWHERHPNGREEEAARKTALLQSIDYDDDLAEDEASVEAENEGFDYIGPIYSDDEY